MIPQVKTQFLLSQKNFLFEETNLTVLPNYENLESPKMTHPNDQGASTAVG